LNESAKPRVSIGIFHDVAQLRDALENLAAAGCSGRDVVLVSDAGALGGRLEEFAAQNGTAADRVQLIMRHSPEPVAGWIAAEYDATHSRLPRDQVRHFETWLASRFADDLDAHLKRGGCLVLCPTFDEAREKAITSVLLRHSAESVQIHDIRPAG
jgi:hypothetical protein